MLFSEELIIYFHFSLHFEQFQPFFPDFMAVFILFSVFLSVLEQV